MKKTQIEECLKYHSISDLKKMIEKPFDWVYWKELSNEGWTVDECGNAQNQNLYIDIRGVLNYLDGSKDEQTIDEWINDDDFKSKYPIDYFTLIKYLKF